MAHAMLDFETWGTKPGSMLRSIGACTFDPNALLHGKASLQATFYANLAEEKQAELKLEKDPGTVAWWNGPKMKAASAALIIDQRDIVEVAREFARWWQTNNCTHVWAQGSNFDPVLWEEVLRRIGMKAPWEFWNTRDTRTVYELAGLDTRTLKRSGTHHNALDDSLFQATCVQMAVKMIFSPKQPKAA